ncbi:MAG: hypothetical protein R3C16_12610 [Hyphomonadaceae bacterium]
MPGMTGQEALKEIRLRRGDLPCIVLTASGGTDTVVQAMQVTPRLREACQPRADHGLDPQRARKSNLKTEVGRMKKRATGQLSRSTTWSPTRRSWLRWCGWATAAASTFRC